MRLSLDAELDRLLAESQESTRYVDVAMQLRRLTITPHVPEGTALVDETGRSWVAGEVENGVQPVVSEQIGASTTAQPGLPLRWAGGVAELVVEVVASAGGQWDQARRRDWRRDDAGQRVPARAPVVVDLMESQIEAARWAAERVAAFREQRPHPQAVAELFSDRRAGKSFLGVLVVLLVAIDCPSVNGLPLVAWMVSTQHSSREELDRIIKATLPPAMYVYRELPHRQYRLANGATLMHKTVDDPEAQLRSGYVDVCLLNEAANMPFAAYRITLRGTQDRNGFLCLATNKPTRTRGNWVVKLADGAERDEREGRVPAVKLLRLDPKKNAAISQEAKSTIDRALRYGVEEGEELDEGVILEADDKCYAPPFDLAQHVRPLPLFGFVDVTAEVLKRIWGRPYGFLVGQDYQQQPAAVAFRIMARDTRPESIKAFTIVAVHSWFLRSGGDEHDLLDEMEADGYTAENCLVVGDSSGGWQKGDHGYGPPSFSTLKSRGWDVTGPTKPKTTKAKYGQNPNVERSVGQVRNLIREGRLVVADCEATTALQKSLHKCDATIDRFGNLRPKGIYSHLTDCVRYPLWWLSSKVDAAAAPQPGYVTAGRR